jgi:hypothetical protein
MLTPEEEHIENGNGGDDEGTRNIEERGRKKA